MMTTVGSFLRRGRHWLGKLALDPRLREGFRAGGYVLSGFCLSAASLGNIPQPLSLALVCANTGWPAVLMTMGGVGGAMLLWGAAGRQCALWLVLGLGLALTVGAGPMARQTRLLMPSLAGLIVAVTGVVFLLWQGDRTAVGLYLLRIALAVASTWILQAPRKERDPVYNWLILGLWILSLAQLMPLPMLNLGCLAAAAATVSGAFPGAAVAGLALDLARVTPVPMTAVLCLGWLCRYLNGPGWVRAVAPAVAGAAVMGLTASPDAMILPGLLVGGVAGLFLPGPKTAPRRRGETGAAQVRLEMGASVLFQAEQLLLEAEPVPIDTDSLLRRGAERACGGCPCRKGCREREKTALLSGVILNKPLLTTSDLPFSCRKTGRLLGEFHRCQEQLRAMRADRRRQTEYRQAVIQQYRFLGSFLQDLSDSLPRRSHEIRCRFRPEVAFRGNRPEEDNGDRCLKFAGVGGKYYVLLCDGMGTGMGAVEDSRTAAAMLRRLLTAGFPAEYALRSLNSLCALRGRAGAVTVDLAELSLDTGRGILYKWGAAPSYLCTAAGAEKIGTAGPPPGLSVTDGLERAERLSLRRGEMLVMVSDGVGGEEALRCCMEAPSASPGELAQRIIQRGQEPEGDDATVAVIRLIPASTST